MSSSLMKTLGKVAVGMAVAKGLQHVSGGSRRQAGGGLENILGELSKAAGGSSGAGGLEDLLGGLTGAAGGQSGGLGDLLGGLAGAATQGGSQGGLGDLLGGLAGVAGGSKSDTPDLGGILSTVLAGAAANKGGGQMGGLGGLLDGLAGAGAAGQFGTGSGGLGDLLNQSLDSFGQAEIAATPDQEDAARYLLVAMLEAAKADGEIDASEKKALMDAMADASAADQAFIQDILARPVDVDAIVENLPNDMYQQAYAMSLLAIDLNNQAEAQHLHSMASAMGISKTEVNAIHQQMGEPALYT